MLESTVSNLSNNRAYVSNVLQLSRTQPQLPNKLINILPSFGEENQSAHVQLALPIAKFLVVCFSYKLPDYSQIGMFPQCCVHYNCGVGPMLLINSRFKLVMTIHKSITLCFLTKQESTYCRMCSTKSINQ